MEKINKMQDITNEDITIELKEMPSFAEGLLVATAKHVAGKDKPLLAQLH